MSKTYEGPSFSDEIYARINQFKKEQEQQNSEQNESSEKTQTDYKDTRIPGIDNDELSEQAQKIIKEHLDSKSDFKSEKSKVYLKFRDDLFADKIFETYFKDARRAEFVKNPGKDSILHFLSYDEYTELVTQLQFVAKTLNIDDSNMGGNYVEVTEQLEIDLNVLLFAERIKAFLNRISLSYTESDLIEKGEEFIKIYGNIKVQAEKLFAIPQPYSKSAIIVITDFLKDIGRSRGSDEQAKDIVVKFLERMIESNRIETYEIIESNDDVKPNLAKIKTHSSQSLAQYDEIPFHWYSQLDYIRNTEKRVCNSFMSNIKFMKDLRKRLGSKKLFKSKFDSLEKQDVDISVLCNALNNPADNSILEVMSDFERVTKSELLKYIIELKSENKDLQSELKTSQNKLAKMISTLNSFSEEEKPKQSIIRRRSNFTINDVSPLNKANLFGY